jgi:WD40 repeat protein
VKTADIQTDEAQEGLVLFWSLRNPDYPEKILRTAHSVTSLDFSKQRPMILAVGLSNGDVNVYDVKREGVHWGVPVESSAGMPGSHLDPVWQLKWIMKGIERTETLVSISTDGRVLEWNLKKGLVMSTLMQLKKSGTVCMYSCIYSII